MSPAPASSENERWPLLASRRPHRGWLPAALHGATAPGRLRQLPGDVLIGLPLSLVGRLVGRFERVRTRADVD